MSTSPRSNSTTSTAMMKPMPRNTQRADGQTKKKHSAVADRASAAHLDADVLEAACGRKPGLVELGLAVDELDVREAP